MYRTLCVLALVALCAGLAHSFSWEIVTGVGNRLEFLNINGTVTHTENMTITIYFLSYDPVHNRVLFADSAKIYSFDIGTMKTELLTNVTISRGVNGFAYDPATELLFWTEGGRTIFSISLKPELNNRKVNVKDFILSEDYIQNIVVDSCGGFIYGSTVFYVQKARFNGSEIGLATDKTHYLNYFTIDQQSQKMYWSVNNGIQSADLNGKNVRTIHRATKKLRKSYYLAVSKDFIYWRSNDANNKFYIWQFPKRSPKGAKVEPKLFIERDEHISEIGATYNIEDITRANPNCATLKSLLPDNTVSRDVSLVCVHGAKVSGESRCECAQGYSGERCDGAVCHNYCLHGDCSTSADGQPKCSCNAGYSGERCQVDVCQGYCLNDGVCSLSEESKLLCRCTGHYEGERCEFPVFLMKCSQTISMLRDILNTDVTSDKWVKSSCASTAF